MTTTTPKAGSALDQFLPEHMFAVHMQTVLIDPAEVQLEAFAPGDATAESPTRPHVAPPSSQVQAWPMLSAAMVAIGISLLAFAAFAKFGAP